MSGGAAERAGHLPFPTSARRLTLLPVFGVLGGGSIGADAGDLQDDGFIVRTREMLLRSGVCEDAARRQGLEFGGVVL